MKTLGELRAMLRENKIRRYSHRNKERVAELLKEKGLLTADDVDLDFGKTIRTNPKRVALRDIETDEELTFPSVYKSAKFIGKSPRITTFLDGRTWENKCEIKVQPSIILFRE